MSRIFKTHLPVRAHTPGFPVLMHRLIHERLLLKYAIKPSRGRNGCIVGGAAETVVEFPDAVARNQEFIRL